MNKINVQLKKIKSQKRLGLMSHIVVGYPDLEKSKQLALAMLEAGVDFLELQIPFSDPMADGPTLMRANQAALQAGVTVRQAMRVMAEMSKQPAPLLFMTYFNIVLQYGAARFCQDAGRAGCSGLIVPDIPLDEENRERFIYHAKQNNLIPIRLLSPASTNERMRLNAGFQDGFVYFVSRKGITGAKAKLESDIAGDLIRVKKFFSAPIAVGFGISKPEHLKQIKKHVAIAVVGSKTIDLYNQAPGGHKLKAVKRFLSELVIACRKK